MKSLENYTEAVTAIRDAILRSQHRSLSAVNRGQLSLYYGIGGFVSQNSREGFWGKGAIEQISKMLQKELPGLRGFSASNMKNMRSFYEEWDFIVNRQPLAGDLQGSEYQLITNKLPLATDLVIDKNKINANRQPLAGDLL